MTYEEWLVLVYICGAIVSLMLTAFSFGEMKDEDLEEFDLGSLIFILIFFNLLSWVTVAIWLGTENKKNKNKEEK